MDKTDWFKKIVELIKLFRPEFYNKVTWAIVTAGILLLGSSLIEKIISAFLEKEFEINITDGNDSLLGILLIMVALIYHYSSRRLELNKQLEVDKDNKNNVMVHDKELFNKLNDFLKESDFRYIMDWVNREHAYGEQQSKPIDDFLHYSVLSDFEFLTPQIERAKKDFSSVLNKYRYFTSINFFVPKGATSTDRYCLYPDMNIDRGGYPTAEEEAFYEKKAGELNNEIQICLLKFEHYRRSIKECLFI